MTALYETIVVIGMFLLRLGIPLALIMLVTAWLRRLDTRWAAEASAYTRAQAWDAQATQIPLVQAMAASPCWTQRNCSAEQRLNCVAHQQPALPCWLARMRQEGRLPASCVNCALFALPHKTNPSPLSLGAGDD